MKHIIKHRYSLEYGVNLSIDNWKRLLIGFQHLRCFVDELNDTIKDTLSTYPYQDELLYDRWINDRRPSVIFFNALPQFESMDAILMSLAMTDIPHKVSVSEFRVVFTSVHFEDGFMDVQGQSIRVVYPPHRIKSLFNKLYHGACRLMHFTRDWSTIQLDVITEVEVIP